MKSMTGYGQAVVSNDFYELSLEIKSVNNRFLDLQIRLPKDLNPHEAALRQIAKEKVQRGRVELYLNLTPINSGTKQVAIDWSLITELIEKMQAGAKHIGAINLSTEDILIKLVGQPDYIKLEEQKTDSDSLADLVIEAAEQAFDQLIASRSQEGTGILAVLVDYQQKVFELVEELKSFVTLYEADYQKRYEAKLQEYLGNTVDQDRLLTELAILLERGDIHEELDRLTIHLTKLAELLQKDIPVGRELDFLLQEINREVNTIGSKSSPIQIKDIVVQLKTILEKIREQIQNVE